MSSVIVERVADNVQENVFSRKLLTLLEILQFKAGRFVEAQRMLTLIATRVLQFQHAKWIDRLTSHKETVMADVKQDLEAMKSLFKEMSLSMCVLHAEELISQISARGEVRAEHIAAFQETLERELKTRVFLPVAIQRQKYFDCPLEGWEIAIEKFPDCREDVEEMSKCYALSRYTAAVFHSLLVSEHGLIVLGRQVGVNDPKPGWDATYRRLDHLVNNRRDIPAGIDFAFVEQTKARVESMKHAWRNKVNHAAGRLVIEKSGFNDFSAEEVIIATRSFMRQLAEGLP